jgi:hypothetical protein
VSKTIGDVIAYLRHQEGVALTCLGTKGAERMSDFRVLVESLKAENGRLRAERDAAVALREEAEARADTCHTNHAGAMARLREEAMDARSAMRTANIALERATKDRDTWKARAEAAESDARLGRAVRGWVAMLRDLHANLVTVESLASEAERRRMLDHEERIVGKLLRAIAIALRAEQPTDWTGTEMDTDDMHPLKEEGDR